MVRQPPYANGSVEITKPIFTGSTTDEPIYSMLKHKMKEIHLFNDINELHELKEFDNDDKDQEKLIVFDDFINLKKAEMKLIK